MACLMSWSEMGRQNSPTQATPCGWSPGYQTLRANVKGKEKDNHRLDAESLTILFKFYTSTKDILDLLRCGAMINQLKRRLSAGNS